MLSDGIDCHLIASIFSSLGIPIELVNYNQYPLYFDLSSRVAIKSARSLGNNFTYSIHDLSNKTDDLIRNEYSLDLFKASTQLNPRLFSLANIGMYTAFDRAYSGKCLLSGDSYPSLSVKHTKSYPHEMKFYSKKSNLKRT